MNTTPVLVALFLCVCAVQSASIVNDRRASNIQTEIDVEDLNVEDLNVPPTEIHGRVHKHHHHQRHYEPLPDNGTFTFPSLKEKIAVDRDDHCQRGLINEEGPEVTWHNDRCETCRCVESTVQCKAETCPDLPCSSPVKVQNECCPMCPEHICQSADGRWFSEGANWHIDDCTFCECSKGKVLCSVEDCEWKPCKNPIKVPGQCCPICPDTSCFEANGLNHTSQSVWKKGACTHCYCGRGRVTCAEEKCPYINCTDSYLPEGECCPTCPNAIECVVSSWGSWSECPIQECGGGMRRRVRSVVVPARNGGTFCPHMSEAQECPYLDCENIPVCPVTEWSRWSHCTATCGSGRKMRRREKTKVSKEEMTSLIDCDQTHMQESITCDMGTCFISFRSLRRGNNEPSTEDYDHCQHFVWSSWSKCSKACGKGVRSRHQIIDNATAPPHSHPCPILRENKPCHGHKCDVNVNCKVTEWSAWTDCSATCGKASKSKHRSILRHPSPGGRLCPNLVATRSCRYHECPVVSTATPGCVSEDGKNYYHDWDHWSPEECITCYCRNSKKICAPEFCPKPDCAETIKVEGFCCPFCV